MSDTTQQQAAVDYVLNHQPFQAGALQGEIDFSKTIAETGFDSLDLLEISMALEEFWDDDVDALDYPESTTLLQLFTKPR